VTEQDFPKYYGVGLLPLHCPGCGCELSDYEVFACRLRGLEKPVCLGCLADSLVWMKKYLLPMLDTALKMLEGRR
jgi:hypothetical protein